MTNEERAKWISERLETTFQPTFLVVHDDSSKHVGHVGAGGAGHFTVEISSAQFDDKPLLECHRLIYQVLAEAIPDEIHALKIKVKR